jgi:hypothetical protein
MTALGLPPYIYCTSSDPWAAAVAFGLLVVAMVLFLTKPKKVRTDV